MTSEPIRDPLADHLITPHNSAFLLIDWQPTQIATVRSADQDLLLRNAVSTVRTVKAYGVPVVHSTGGLADTITNLNDETLATGKANGFSFDTYDVTALTDALNRACRSYYNRPIWEQLVRTGILAVTVFSGILHV